MMRRVAIFGCGMWLLTACGQQYSDPILERSAEPTCPETPVLELGGASFASAPRPIQDDFTIELWLKTASSPTGPGFFEGSALVFADVETVQVDDFALGIVNDKAIFSIGGPDTAVVGTSRVTTDEWVHVAATRTRASGVAQLFVDGVLEATAIGNQNSLSQSPSISFGGRSGRNFFEGSMADLRLWNRARSQAEILATMHQRLRGDEPGLVGYYRFDEASGGVAHDASTSQSDAVITGDAEWAQSVVPLCSL